MNKLILIRHGETNINAIGKLHASNDTEMLNSIGITQMKKVADALVQYSPHKIFASKEKRAQESATIIAKELCVPVVAVDGLEERNWGEFSQKSYEEIRPFLESLSNEERYTFVPPNGESWEVCERRLIKTVQGIIQDNTNENVAIVTHGGAIRILMPFLLNTSIEETYKHDPRNASLTIFDITKDGFAKIKLDDISHLNS